MLLRNGLRGIPDNAVQSPTPAVAHRGGQAPRLGLRCALAPPAELAWLGGSTGIMPAAAVPAAASLG